MLWLENKKKWPYFSDPILLSDLDAFAVIFKRETEKELRDKQNEVIKELDPLIFSLHLGSMKIFFQNVETEEKTIDGEVLGELDQVSWMMMSWIKEKRA